MNLEFHDNEFNQIIKDILEHNEFQKMRNIEHHGITRLDHSLKVSYYSYKIAKAMHLDYTETARGGLLHDFYLDGNERSKGRKFLDTFTHPKKALSTSTNSFNLNEIEKNIIISHMFPIYLSIPKYKESILVNWVDKVIGTYEMSREYKYKFKYQFNYLYVLFGIIMLNK